MTNSTVTDFLIRLKNGSLANRQLVTAPSSRFLESVALLMKKYGYIESYSVNLDKNKKTITVNLAYADKLPVLTNVTVFSKPGRRVYSTSYSLPWGKSKDSLIIISTSSGLMSQKEAQKRHLGGEVIAEIS